MSNTLNMENTTYKDNWENDIVLLNENENHNLIDVGYDDVEGDVKNN